MDTDRSEFETAGYEIVAAPLDSWRDFDPRQPSPGYFEFDWLSARHPDLYHRFALATTGLMKGFGGPPVNWLLCSPSTSRIS